MRILKSTAMLTVAALFFVTALPAAGIAKTLYERLGGQPAIQAVANGLVDSILADSRVNQWFAHAAASPQNAAAYKAKLADFLCQSTQGPCKYSGLDMTAAHKGRAVTGEAFDAVVEDLIAVLVKLKVPAKEKGEVLALLGPLKTVIVQK
ncbi:MAG: group 1 truncated hemoglobin [Bryobacteraceae bacterium]